MPTTQKGLDGPALSHAQMDENFALVDTNEVEIASLQDQIDEQQIVGEITFGENNVDDAFVPFVITDTVTGTLQDSFTTPNQNVDGDWEKIIYSNPITRYTSGGKLM